MTSAGQMLEMDSATMGDVALQFPQSIELLKRYDLDYCCHGKKLFSVACRDANIDPVKVWKEVQLVPPSKSGDQLNFENLSSSVLVDIIVQHHHEYVRESIPNIQNLLDKVCSVHSQTDPELIQVRSDFNALAEELLGHLPKEEQILFPAIKRIEGQPISFVESKIETTALDMPIHVMEEEHERAGTLIKSIRSRTNHYTPPSYACPTYQLTLTMLQEFDNNLLQHIHLENNILFPRFKSIVL